jgi:hypothetical protein
MKKQKRAEKRNAPFWEALILESYSRRCSGDAKVELFF